MTQHPEEGTLHAYIDGELSLAETAALELHVGECARCAAALAEARGFVAAASRVITTLDAAPSSAVTPAAAVAGVPAAPSRRVVRPIFRVPYARAAALFLLVGSTAFVVDRTGTFARGKSTPTESVMADAATGSDLAATAPVEAATTSATGPVQAPGPTAVGATLSTGAGSGATGNVRQESVAPRKMAAVATTDGATRARSAERSAPSSETAPAAFAGRGVAGGVATQDAVPPMTEPSILAGRDVVPEVAKPAAFPTAPPPPARMDMRLQERAASSALNFVPTAVRYRTRDGIIVTLTEEPLRTSVAEESVATLQSAPQSAQRTAAAQMAAPPINSYRWSSAERGKTYTLSGPLTVAELEALSKRLTELERLP
ncbi:MAG: zf-HC2 domain-containing protein [Gemmatimonadaceae bacterium]